MNWKKIRQNRTFENYESEYIDEFKHMDRPNVFESQQYVVI